MDSIKDMLTNADCVVLDICNEIQSFHNEIQSLRNAEEEKRKAKELEEKERARLKEEELFKDSEQKFLDWMKKNKQNIVNTYKTSPIMGCSFGFSENHDPLLLCIYKRGHLHKLTKKYFENTNLRCTIENKDFWFFIRFVYRENKVGMK